MQAVTLAKVLEWLRAAMEAATRDLGDAEGTITALSYRELQVAINTKTGGLSIYVRTHNREFTGYAERTHYAITIGIVTGADWLPREFVGWMKGGGS